MDAVGTAEAERRAGEGQLQEIQSRPACGYSEDGPDVPGWALAAHSEWVLSGDDARALCDMTSDGVAAFTL